MTRIDPHLPLRHPSVLPHKRGLYVRDWRGTDVLPVHERRLSIDLWEPIRDRRDILHPGVWYAHVHGVINEASRERLPWRPLTGEEHFEALRSPAIVRWLMEGDLA